MVRRITTLLVAITAVLGMATGAQHVDATAEPADVAGGYSRQDVVRTVEREGLVTPYLPTTLPRGYYFAGIGESPGNGRRGESTSSLFARVDGALTVEVCARPIAQKAGCDDTARSVVRHHGSVLVRIHFIVAPGQDVTGDEKAFWGSVHLATNDLHSVAWLEG